MKFYEEVLEMVLDERAAREKRGEKLNLEKKVSLVQMFRETIRRRPEQAALMTRKADATGAATWHMKTYEQFAARVDEIAAALLERGVKPGEMITLQSHTREEWAIIDEAVIGINAVIVCAYPSLAPAVVEYQLNDSGTSIAFVESKEHVETLIGLKDKVPSLRLGVAIDDPGIPLPPWFTTLDKFVESGKEALAAKPGLKDEIHAFEKRIDPDSLATIVYTSGTTGMPKGAMLSNWNIASNCLSTKWVASLNLEGMTNLSFLPLSHIFERMAGHFYPIMMGMCTAFASDIDNLSRDLQEVKPQYLTGVPRVFEKIYAFAMLTVNEYSPTKRKAFNWAVEVGKQYDPYFRAGKKVPFMLRFKIKLARALVFKKILEKTGGELLCFISGGASLPQDLARFYGAVGLVILEGYGLTETSPVTNMNDPADVQYGVVGPPIPGTEEKLGPDDEVLVRGHQVFKGYWKKPEQTAEAIDEEGWFHTGDLGKFDEKGRLAIIGRKKEIFVMSTGKKVPPISVEELVATTKFIQQLVLEGDGRKFISALITPNFPAIWAHVKREIPALAPGLPDAESATEGELASFLAKPEITALFQSDIDDINAKVDPFAQVKKFVVIPHELTEETGDMTPSLKFKRRKIAEHYKDLIEGMYEKDTSVELSKVNVRITGQ
ncbi:MAG: long-chain fatty acid--CoA ligase [Candidatus Lokiarchaeota archaeon]|nr:long-chain fatty acid--CoA ligase [Candidatus Lokiarchaeota archaeon]